MKTMMKKIAKLSLALMFVMVLLVSNYTETDAATKVRYTYKTYDKSQTYRGKSCTIRDVEKYRRVIIKGKSKAVRKINQVLKETCDGVLKAMPAGEWVKEDADYRQYDETYNNIYTSKVMYNEKGIISIRIDYKWYQGGVGYRGCNCFTFDLSTGKQLKLTDVCKGSNRALTKKIKDKLVKKYTRDAFWGSGFDSISAEKCDFYLKKGGKVVVTFDQAELSSDGAGGLHDITLKSKY